MLLGRQRHPRRELLFGTLNPDLGLCRFGIMPVPETFSRAAMSKSVFTSEYEVFLDVLVKLRKSAGLTQWELADRLGKTQSFISKSERGERRLDVIELLMIIEAVGADPCTVMRQIENAARER